ncbi:MAG: hypothetical protein NWF01_09560 [Candidatus Bathyarchaeota archaeon]|nr:hypothetical protein [Candidatus Bathyarchaeota archaeon]
MSTTPETPQAAEISKFDAENATSLSADFLKRLGYKGIWSPMKVSLDGELYVVELMFKKLNAKVQINSQTKEIREYEVQKAEEESGGAPTGKIMFLITLISVGALISKLIGVF